MHSVSVIPSLELVSSWSSLSWSLLELESVSQRSCTSPLSYASLTSESLSLSMTTEKNSSNESSLLLLQGTDSMTCSQFLGELQHRGKHWPLSKTSTETELSRLHSEESHRSDRDVSSAFEIVEDKLIRLLSFSSPSCSFWNLCLSGINPGFVSSLPSVGHVSDRDYLSKWNQSVVAGLPGLGFWLSPVWNLHVKSMRLRLRPQEYFALFWEKKVINLSSNHNSWFL